jgi:outer membrane lipoprotein-sorting protein
MRRLRTASRRRLATIVAAVLLLAAGGGIAQAALSGSGPTPDPKPLDRAVLDALNAPAVEGVSARVTFTNGLLPAGSLPNGSASPLAAGAKGRLWVSSQGARLELQSEAGDAQIVADGERVTVYDSASETAYTMPAPRDRAKADRDHEATPADVRRGLDRLAEAWTLSGAQPTSTAGRPTYTVRIAPKDDGGLLGAAELAWDAARGVPLRAAVFAQGQDEPVLELEATDVSYGAIDAGVFDTKPPAGAEIVAIDPPAHEGGEPSRVRGVDAVQQRLGFQLSAPAELAGLPRTDVRLVDANGSPAALSVYGKGMGAILVLQREAGEQREVPEGLPRVNIDGATGTEVATPLGTLVTFDRGGVSYLVVGSVPPVAAENAARGL